METTQSLVDELLTEMDGCVVEIISSRRTDYDWSLWVDKVAALRRHVLSQLERCKGKFDGDLETVGMMTEQKRILESLEYLAKRLEG
jgi:hypothetical protein